MDQLEELGKHLNAPVIDGKTSNAKREKLFQQFREGELQILWYPRWLTSPSICRRPPLPFRSRVPLAPDRKRPSASDAYYAPRLTARKQRSIPS